MMNLLLTIISVANTVLISLTFVKSVFQKIKINTKVILILLGFIAIQTFSTLALEKYVYFKLPINFMMFVLLYTVFFHINIKKSFVINALFFGIFVSIEMIALVLLQRFTKLSEFSDITNQNGAFLAELICHIVFLIIVIVISSFKTKTNLSQLSVKGWIAFLFFPIITAAVVLMMIYGASVELLGLLFDKLIVLTICMFFLNVLLFYLLDNMIEREKEMHDKEILIEQAEHINRMYQSLSAEREKQKAQTHDYLNHLNVVLTLAKEGKNTREIEYLTELIGESESHIDVIDTGNPIINAVLNTKYKESQEKGIIFPLVADNLVNIPIKDRDLVTILSNILDNAIEAVSDIDNKKINLKISRTDDALYIDESNPYEGDPDIDIDHYTTKTDKTNHGYGLSNIRRTVNECNGECFIDTKDNMFYITIIIPLEQ